MNHLLDNPIWTALSSGNKEFAKGNDRAKYFSEEVSPFAAVEEINQKEVRFLFDTVPSDLVFAIFTPHEMKIQEPWKMIQHMKVLQMVYDQLLPKPVIRHHDLVPLQRKDVPEMLSLTKLTDPGPFLPRTIEFGNYMGIFEENRLVAMAGQRLRPSPYVEISAICTHPDYMGNGYARSLIVNQLDQILAEPGIPFLHVKWDNLKAIQLYTGLGFSIRKEFSIYIIEKK